MKILAIDPGNVESAFCIMDDKYQILDFGKYNNDDVMQDLQKEKFDCLVIEMVASYGMAVGQTIFDTVFWAGRFFESIDATNKDRLYRKDVKMNLCHSMRAKDGNVRQALIDRFARFDFKTGKGTKKTHDWFYGVSADVWQAIALGVTYIDKMKGDT